MSLPYLGYFMCTHSSPWPEDITKEQAYSKFMQNIEQSFQTNRKYSGPKAIQTLDLYIERYTQQFEDDWKRHLQPSEHLSVCAVALHEDTLEDSIAGVENISTFVKWVTDPRMDPNEIIS